MAVPLADLRNITVLGCGQQGGFRERRSDVDTELKMPKHPEMYQTETG